MMALSRDALSCPPQACLGTPSHPTFEPCEVKVSCAVPRVKVNKKPFSLTLTVFADGSLLKTEKLSIVVRLQIQPEGTWNPQRTL